MVEYYSVDKKNYDVSWPRVRRTSVKVVFYRNMRILYLHNTERDYYVLPSKDAGATDTNPLDFPSDLAEELFGADISKAESTTLGIGKVLSKNHFAEQLTVENMYIYKLVNLDGIPYDSDRMKAFSKEGFELVWLYIEEADPCKSDRKPDIPGEDYEMLAAEYKGVLEDYSNWLFGYMSSAMGTMLDGPGMVNPAFYQVHQSPTDEKPMMGGFMGMGSPLELEKAFINKHQTMDETSVVAKPLSGEVWICSCGSTNTGRFCVDCGMKKM